MPLASDLLAAIGAAWRLIRRDLSGIQNFDLSTRGFARSFLAVILSLPPALVILYGNLSLQQTIDAMEGIVRPPTIVDGLFLAQYAGATVISWIIFPVVMIFICRALLLSHRYAIFIIVYNWTSLLLTALLAVPFVLVIILAPFVGPVAILLVLFVVEIFSIYIRWFVVRNVLGASGINAVGIVILDVLLGLLVGILMGPGMAEAGI